MPGLTSPARGKGPLTLDEAAALFLPLQAAQRVLIAVSGGPDSTALMHLAARIHACGLLPAPVVATVDHGLNPASHDVAAGVMAAAGRLGLEAHLLRWEGEKPAASLQSRARDARYRLLAALARDLGATHLVTAHTLDDQAETILFRMARGSGPAGLAGMDSSVLREGVVHVRPLLDIPKQRLIDTCCMQGWNFIEDPANRDPRFARARFRTLMPALAAEGLDATRLATLARRLARDEAALLAAAAKLLEAATLSVTRERKILQAAPLLTHPAAIGSRALQAAMTDFARDGTPRLARLETLYDDLCRAHAAGQPLHRTLHGHIVALRRNGVIEVRPEGGRRRGLAPEQDRDP